ncbi:hypothetical protein [Brumimicrobium mesophilum]|uniref:hypothetical protein n=1 Tax=Brumimicrobium mesophilum TaxID=392717 RepID=UPI000D1401C6|nr:hypothetical protein [Brumimicrobium mesophilum]
MKWIGERISFLDKKESISFVIYPPKLGRKKGLLITWFLLWLLIGGYVGAQMLKENGDQEYLMLFIFMTFWLYFAIRVFRSMMYLFFGREYIKLDKTTLRIKRSIGAYGQTKQYFIENISKFEMITLKENSFQKVYDDSVWVRGSNRIQFEFFTKRISFGRKLEDQDAKMMFQILTKRIEKYLKSKKKGE